MERLAARKEDIDLYIKGSFRTPQSLGCFSFFRSYEKNEKNRLYRLYSN